jgi:hypothetical protein
MAKSISFRPTEENLAIFNERESINPNFNKTSLINRSINFFFNNIDKIRELENTNRYNEKVKEANEFALNAVYQEKRESKQAFESQLKTANDKIEQLRIQSTKYQADIEVLKSKNNFLSTQASVLDKKALNELETLRVKVAEQEKDVFNLTAKVGCYENEYLKKAFAEVKGSKLMIQEGKINETFNIDTMFELAKLLSYKYYLHLFKD